MGRSTNNNEVLFSLLEGHDIILPNSALWFLHFLFAMQWVAFTVNEGISWANPIADLQCGFAMTHLPFWDEAGRCFGHSVTIYSIVHWAAVGMVVFCWSVICLLLTNPCRVVTENRRRMINSGNGFLLLLLTEVLFVPFVRVLLEGHPSRLGWPAFLVGLVAVTLLSALTCMARLLLTDLMPGDAASLGARAHGRVHLLLTVTQVVVAAVLAIAPGVAAQLTVTCLSLAMAFVFWYCQPYYRQISNSLYIATFSLSAYSGLLSTITVVAPNSRGLAMMMPWGGCVALVVGYYTPSFRFLPMYPVSDTTFPDMAYSPFDARATPFEPPCDLSNDPSKPHLRSLRGRAKGAAGKAGLASSCYDSDTDSAHSPTRSVHSGAPSAPSTAASSARRYISAFLLPMLRHGEDGAMALCGGIRWVLLPTDVELYLRVLHLQTANLPLPVRDALAEYSEGIYEQALEKYPHSGIVKVHYLLFTAFYSQDLQKTSRYLRALDYQPVPLDVRYFVHKVQAYPHGHSGLCSGSRWWWDAAGLTWEWRVNESFRPEGGGFGQGAPCLKRHVWPEKTSVAGV